MEICTKEDCLVLRYSAGAELLEYNRSIYRARLELSWGIQRWQESLQTFTNGPLTSFL